MAHRQKRIVVLGGGTGTFTVLSALRHYHFHLTAIVNMVDDGGSTGILRDELGALPPGDVRQCLVALSNESQLMRDLLNYRYGNGVLGGHAFGNLLLAALEKMTGSFSEAVRAVGALFKIEGDVIPVTNEDVRLGLRFADGREVLGEKLITQSFFPDNEQPHLFLRPVAAISPAAAAALAAADLILVGPGNLYSSLIPTLLVEGVSRALQSASAPKVYICNLVTKPGQTDGFQVHDFVSEIERYAGRGVFATVIYNTGKPRPRLLSRYHRQHEEWVRYEPALLANQSYRAIGADLISRAALHQPPNDHLLQRNLIRHDPAKLARLIRRLLAELSGVHKQASKR